jgi:hypothetical protein
MCGVLLITSLSLQPFKIIITKRKVDSLFHVKKLLKSEFFIRSPHGFGHFTNDFENLELVDF